MEIHTLRSWLAGAAGAAVISGATGAAGTAGAAGAAAGAAATGEDLLALFDIISTEDLFLSFTSVCSGSVILNRKK